MGVVGAARRRLRDAGAQPPFTKYLFVDALNSGAADSPFDE
jgi:hypothetical protein